MQAVSASYRNVTLGINGASWICGDTKGRQMHANIEHVYDPCSNRDSALRDPGNVVADSNDA